MTSEIRTLVEPKDIVAVELECAHCNSRVTRTLAKWLREPSTCANCGAIWIHLAEEFKQLSLVVSALKLMAHRQEASESPAVMVRFELAAPPRKDVP